MANQPNCIPNGGDNRTRRMAAIEAFKKSLDDASAQDFTGTVAVEVSSKEGRLAGAKVTTIRWPKT